jgi:hypothetical protein
MKRPWYLRGAEISFKPTKIDAVGCDGIYIKSFDGVSRFSFAYLLVIGLSRRAVALARSALARMADTVRLG